MIPLNIQEVFHSFTVAENGRVYDRQVETFRCLYTLVSRLRNISIFSVSLMGAKYDEEVKRVKVVKRIKIVKWIGPGGEKYTVSVDSKKGWGG